MSIRSSKPNVRSKKAATSIDVAATAGVSQATVSRFLNGKSVSPSVHEAISKAIVALDYRPNDSARSLVTSRTNVVAVVLGDILNGYYGEIFATLHKALGHHGLRPLILEGRVSMADDPGQLLAAVHADGVIVTTSLMHPDQEALILARKLPTVMLNRSNVPGVDSVSTQNRRGGELAAQHLVDLGHRRMGMITGPSGAEAIIERSAGFAGVLARSGIVLNDQKVIAAGFDYDRAYAAASRLMARVPHPTAIFCHNDQIAIAAMNAATMRGLRIPDDLSVIGFDDVRMSAWERLSLTTVRQPVREIATAAVDLLAARLADPSLAPRAMTFPCELMQRDSTGPNRELNKARSAKKA